MESDLNALVTAVKGERVIGELAQTFRGVSIDSRAMQPGELFVCIKGDRFDGHAFLSQVIANQAAGVVVSDKEALKSAPLKEKGAFAVAVPDTLHALQELAAYHRSQSPVRVVGVTGTNGKSTTKEMIAGIISTRFNTLKTLGNLNNHIGLPLSLLKLDESHEVAVLEMGMSGAGEIARLAEIARPQIGVITNISRAHMIDLKSLQNIQAAKGELFQALDASATAVVNADDPLVRELAQNIRARVLTFGIDQPADIRAEDIQHRGETGFDFKVHTPGGTVPIHLPLLGRFNIYNALAAVAVGQVLGIATERMNEGIQNLRMLRQRNEVVRHHDIIFLNDTYNANPQSVREAMRTLEQFDAPGKKFLVMGDMLELGDETEPAHRQIGAEAAALAFDGFVCVGERARLAGESALASGMNAARVALFNEHQEAVDYLAERVGPGDCLLFKGSRGMRMEQVLEGLMKQI